MSFLSLNLHFSAVGNNFRDSSTREGWCHTKSKTLYKMVYMHHNELSGFHDKWHTILHFQQRLGLGAYEYVWVFLVLRCMWPINVRSSYIFYLKMTHRLILTVRALQIFSTTNF